MKKITLIGLAVTTAIGFTACQKENIAGEQTSNLIKETFSAGFQQEDTKTAISGDATVTWTEGDAIYYYTKDAGTKRSANISAAGASASLTLERETTDSWYNLVYAGNANPTFTTNTESSLIFDGVKTAQDGTFQSANISVAHTTPGGSGITFKPVTALVKFSTARTDIKTIVLTGNNNERIAGNISVDPTATAPIATLNGTGEKAITATIGTPAAGTYYINVIPVTLSKGLMMTLTSTDGKYIATIKASKNIDLSAGGKMINLGNIDGKIQPSYSPTAEYNLRLEYKNESWTWKTKTDASEQAQFEINHNSRFCAIQQYQVPGIKNATSVTLVLTDTGKNGSDALAIWVPNGTWTSDMSPADFNTLYTNTTGITPGTAGTATKDNLLKDVATLKSPSRFTFTGDALTLLKNSASADGTITLLITNKIADMEANSNSKRQFQSSNSANNNPPVLTVE